jgi:hypothetical protein
MTNDLDIGGEGTNLGPLCDISDQKIPKNHRWGANPGVISK